MSKNKKNYSNKSASNLSNNKSIDNQNQKINSLNEQIKQLQKLIEDKDKQILELKNEINQINQDYVNQIKAKAEQANQIINLKAKEINDKANQEITLIKKYAIEKDAVKLIEIINQFENALSIPTTDEKLKRYQSGYKMFLTMLKNLLKDMNIEEIKINVGDQFNPDFMQVLETSKLADFANDQVTKIHTKAYKLYDRTIQPALVNVNKLK